MAIRNLRFEGDPILRKTSKEVKEITPKIVELVDDMLETMYESNGVGLAAPQVGVLKRIVVIDVGEGPIVLHQSGDHQRRKALRPEMRDV